MCPPPVTGFRLPVARPTARMPSPRRRWRPTTLLAALPFALASCGVGDAPAALRLGRKGGGDSIGTCPPITGTVEYQPNDLAHALTRMLPWAARQAPWWTITAVGSADSVLVLALHRFDGTRDTVALRRGADYGCGDGWLRPRGADAMFDAVPYDDAGHRANRDEFQVAIDEAGHWVGRRTATTWDEFAVWCGDGCRGVPLPWTIRHHVRWSLLAAPGDDVPDTPHARDAQQRMLDEERRLEYGDPVADAPAARRAAREQAVFQRRALERERAIESGTPLP